jgi:hypothetical protein
MAPRRANLKAPGRLALRCSAASRAMKAAAAQVDATRPARDNAGVKQRDEGAGGKLACAFFSAWGEGGVSEAAFSLAMLTESQMEMFCGATVPHCIR